MYEIRKFVCSKLEKPTKIFYLSLSLALRLLLYRRQVFPSVRVWVRLCLCVRTVVVSWLTGWCSHRREMNDVHVCKRKLSFENDEMICVVGRHGMNEYCVRRKQPHRKQERKKKNRKYGTGKLKKQICLEHFRSFSCLTKMGCDIMFWIAFVAQPLGSTSDMATGAAQIWIANNEYHLELVLGALEAASCYFCTYTLRVCEGCRPLNRLDENPTNLHGLC